MHCVLCTAHCALCTVHCTGLGVNDGFFHLGKYSHIPSEGFKMAPESGSGGQGMVQVVAGGTICSAPTLQDDFCGTYAQACYPVLPSTDGATVTESYNAEFEYCGDKSTGSFSTANAGWFNRTVSSLKSATLNPIQSSSSREKLLTHTRTLSSALTDVRPFDDATAFEGHLV